MRSPDWISVRALPLFCEMGEENFDRLVDGAFCHRFPKYANLVTEGDTADFLYVLVDGRIDRRRADKILQILLKEKVLVRVTEDLIFHRAALEELRRRVARRKLQSPRLNVAVFKELTGLTRKYAIPLLEYLDRERVTRREGDERIIL